MATPTVVTTSTEERSAEAEKTSFGSAAAWWYDWVDGHRVGAAALVGVPLLVLLVVVALLFKLWGMTAVFHAFGLWLLRRVTSRRAAPLHAACAGLLALGVLKFFPWVGVVGWTAATLIGVGATVLTKFGRGGPWFTVDPAAA